MDATLRALGGILLQGIPTLILLVLLHIYLKAMFFKPIEKILEKRREATEGARAAAEESAKKAEQRAAEYEAKLQEARSGIYREQEALRKKWVEEQTRRLEEARANSRELIQVAKHEIDQDVAAAKRDLSATAAALADQIADSLLSRRAS